MAGSVSVAMTTHNCMRGIQPSRRHSHNSTFLKAVSAHAPPQIGSSAAAHAFVRTAQMVKQAKFTEASRRCRMQAHCMGSMQQQQEASLHDGPGAHRSDAGCGPPASSIQALPCSFRSPTPGVDLCGSGSPSASTISCQPRLFVCTAARWPALV
jgi:hypothetical protein